MVAGQQQRKLKRARRRRQRRAETLTGCESRKILFPLRRVLALGDGKKEVIERPKRFESSHCLGALPRHVLRDGNSLREKQQARSITRESRRCESCSASWDVSRRACQVATLNGTMSEFKAVSASGREAAQSLTTCTQRSTSGVVLIPRGRARRARTFWLFAA